MKQRRSVWNVLFILGVLYLLVFGFLYVYMQREPVAEQLQGSAETPEVLAREVDILDAPLIADVDDPEANSNDAAEDSNNRASSSAAAASLLAQATSASGSAAETPTSTDTETPTEVQEGAANPVETPSDTVVEAADTPAASSSATFETVAAAPEAESEGLKGSGAPYRYNLNTMDKNTRLQTDAGWVTFEGKLDAPQESQSYFLVVQSLLRDPPTLFSQGRLNLDDEGNYEVRAKYATYSEFYKTYIITTANERAAQRFSNEGSSSGLPSGFSIVRPEIEVLVE